MDPHVAPIILSDRPLPSDELVLATLARAESAGHPCWDLQLRIRDGRGERVVPLAIRGYRIGRAADNDLVIDDPAVPEHVLRAWGVGSGLLYVPLDAGFPTGNARHLAGLSLFETLRMGNAELRLELSEVEAPREGDYLGMVGRSPRMLELYQRVEQVAPGEQTVLVLGPSGTGKEAVAKAVHARSSRAKGPFIPVNCSALTASLAESELFGVEKGAFTGATHSRQGLVEAATGGTLFLDEVGELPLALQAKFLRLLQEKEIRRVGSTVARIVDVRFILATNVDLEAAVNAGTFRADLYYRIKSCRLLLPPLSERRGDAVRLARHFLRLHNTTGHPATLSEDAAYQLGLHRFGGEVRELEGTIENAVSRLQGSPLMTPEHLELPPEPEAEAAEAGAVAVEAGGPSAESDEWLYLPGKTVLQIQREADEKCLRRWGGNVAAAAEELGVHRNTVTKWLK